MRIKKFKAQDTAVVYGSKWLMGTRKIGVKEILGDWGERKEGGSRGGKLQRVNVYEAQEPGGTACFRGFVA